MAIVVLKIQTEQEVICTGRQLGVYGLGGSRVDAHDIQPRLPRGEGIRQYMWVNTLTADPIRHAPF